MARICKFVNQSSSFPELFLDLTTTEPEPELFSFCIFGGAGARAGKARQARLVLEPEPGSLDISAMDSDKIKYCEMKEEDLWRLNVVNELTDVKYGEAEVVGFSRDELKAILLDVCSS